MELTLWERTLGWFWAFAMVLFVGLMLFSVFIPAIKNFKNDTKQIRAKPLSRKQIKHLIIILVVGIIYIIFLSSPTLPRNNRMLVFFIGNLIFVIYIFRTYYIQEKDKKNNTKIPYRRKVL